MLQKFDKTPQRLTPAELHPCCHHQFTLWCGFGDVSETASAKGPSDVTEPSGAGRAARLCAGSRGTAAVSRRLATS